MFSPIGSLIVAILALITSVVCAVAHAPYVAGTMLILTCIFVVASFTAWADMSNV